MLNIFNYLMGNTSISFTAFLVPIAASLLMGLILSLIHMYKNRTTGSFLMTLVILPAIVCTVIMAVNGNIGAGVAVAGAFTLVRFRSAPGSAREICALFTAMTSGLLAGMGYIIYAFLFVAVIGAAIMICQISGITGRKDDGLHKNLRITIPEDLDYTGVFDELFDSYTTEHSLLSSKTTGMGSMYKLTYEITLKSREKEKEFIDKLRCRNGNLEISMSVLEGREATEL